MVSGQEAKGGGKGGKRGRTGGRGDGCDRCVWPQLGCGQSPQRKPEGHELGGGKVGPERPKGGTGAIHPQERKWGHR